MSPRQHPSRLMVALFVAALGLTCCGLMATTRHNALLRNEPPTTAHSAPVPLPNPYVVELLGRELSWHYRLPGSNGAFRTLVDPLEGGSLKVPAEHAVTLRFQSADFVYTWALPALDAEQIAVPGLTFEVTLPPLPEGRYDFLGTPFCGRDHSRLSGQLISVARDQFLARSADASTVPQISAGFRPAPR